MTNAKYEVDHPARWRRCPHCGEKKPGVRKDPRTGKTQCDPCWFSTIPAWDPRPEGER